MFTQKIREWAKFLLRKETEQVLGAIHDLDEARKREMLARELAQKSSPLNQITQCNLVATWKQSLASGCLLSLRDVGFRNFSQFDEDGILLYLFTAIGAKSRTFVGLGGADGINSNCANLAINHGWTGAFIDGDECGIDKGRQYYEKLPETWLYPPTFINAMISRENIDELIEKAGVRGEVDLLSIDIDGNDYWVWDAMENLSPRVVVVETHVEFGLHSIVVPYDADYVYPGKHPQYHGASPVAMMKLAKRKGYRLIGSNNYGFNTIYLRNDVGEDLFPEVPVESVLAHPRNAGRMLLFDEIRDWDYLSV